MNSKICYGIIILSFILLFILSMFIIVYYNTIKLSFVIGSTPQFVHPLRNEGYDKINFKEKYTNIPRVIYLTYKDKNRKIIECVENWEKTDQNIQLISLKENPKFRLLNNNYIFFKFSR